MTFVTTAKEVNAAKEAGLELVGCYHNGSPEYLGSSAQWSKYITLLFK